MAHHTDTTEIRSIKELVDLGLRHVPAPYIRPTHERPRLRSDSFAHMQQDSSETVPVVDLSWRDKASLVHEIGRACSDWGIFQVTSHGISAASQSRLWSAANRFFAMPTDTKLEIVSKHPSCPLLFFTGFFHHETVREWKDTLGFKPTPSTNPKHLPHFLREPILRFHEQMKILAEALFELVFASLSVDSKDVSNQLSRATIGFNYYPTCPEPELTFGLSSHSDFGSLTIIKQDEVEGLQVKRKDGWVNVRPVPNSFIVMLGDQIEILTNGLYKSVEHRVVTNKRKPRMSIACFYGPSEHEKVKPLDRFVNENNPLIYKETLFSDYLRNGFGKALDGKSNLRFIARKCSTSI